MQLGAFLMVKNRHFFNKIGPRAEQNLDESGVLCWSWLVASSIFQRTFWGLWMAALVWEVGYRQLIVHLLVNFLLLEEKWYSGSFGRDPSIDEIEVHFVIAKGLKWINIKACIFIGAPADRPEASSLFLCSYSFSLSSPQLFHFRLVIFTVAAFHSLLSDVTPVVCQTGGRRCLVWPLSPSLPLSPPLPLSLRLYFSLTALFFKWSPPTRCCDTAFLGIGWQCGSRSFLLFFLTFSASPYFLHHNTSIHPSIHPGHCWAALLSARSWRTRPLTHASPCWPAAAVVLLLVLHVYLGGQGQTQLLFLKGGRSESGTPSFLYVVC